MAVDEQWMSVHFQAPRSRFPDSDRAERSSHGVAAQHFPVVDSRSRNIRSLPRGSGHAGVEPVEVFFQTYHETSHGRREPMIAQALVFASCYIATRE